jgi:thiamine kinase-like enzyme
MKGLLQAAHDLSLLEHYQALPGGFDWQPGSREDWAQQLGTEAFEMQLGYVRFKPGHALCLGYALRREDGREEWWTEKLRPSADIPRERWLFPHDPELRGCARAFDLERRVRELRPLPEFGSLDLRWRRSRMETLRYKPERRAVLRMQLASRDAAGTLSERLLAWRVLEPHAAQRTAAARTAAAHTALQLDCVPRLIFAHAEHGHLCEEWLHTDGSELDDAMFQSLLARLHATPCSQEVPLAPRLSQLEELLPLFDPFPELHAAAQLVGTKALSGREGWIHGDCHRDQSMSTRHGARWLDLDNLGRGPLVRDYLSLAADGAPEGAWERLSALNPFVCGVDENQLRWALAGELVRRAAAHLRRLEVRAREQAGVALQCARELLPGRCVRVEYRDEERIETWEECDRTGQPAPQGHAAQPSGPWRSYAAGRWQACSPHTDVALPGLVQWLSAHPEQQAQLVSYRPGRRAVRVQADRVTKWVRQGKARRLGERHARLAQTLSLRVAPLLEIDESHNALHFAHLSARPFAAQAGESAWRALCADLAHWRAAAAGASKLGLDRHSARDEYEQLLDLQRRQRVHGLKPLDESLQAELGASLPIDEPAVPAHRDLYPEQLLCDAQGLWWLDLDLAALAAPELDPANFLAHLELEAARGRLSAQLLQGWRTALEAYVLEAAVLDATAPQSTSAQLQRWRWYLAISLLRVAHVWRERMDGLFIQRSLLKRAREVLHETQG